MDRSRMIKLFFRIGALTGLLSLLAGESMAQETDMVHQEDAPMKTADVTPLAKPSVAGGVVHELPPDLRTALLADAEALARWEAITPLARNEWICWVESVKKETTRADHIARMRDELKAGKRRPCCWPGCPHRVKSGK